MSDNSNIIKEGTYTVNDISLECIAIFTPVTNQNNEIENIIVNLIPHEGIKADNSKEFSENIVQREEEIEKLKTQISKLELKVKEAGKTQLKQEISVPQKLSENELIDWNSSYETGLTEMDEQHQNLVQLANQLYIALKKDKSKKEIKDTLKAFTDYAAYHFGNEERYFAEFNFSEESDHKKQHSEFLSKINLFQKDYLANKVRFLDDIMNFISTWLSGHFNNYDKQYVDLFKKNGLV